MAIDPANFIAYDPAAGGHTPPFKKQVEYIDRQIPLTATGGLLPMLADRGTYSPTLPATPGRNRFPETVRKFAVRRIDRVPGKQCSAKPTHKFRGETR